jgi:hypothetical protein
MLVDPLRQQGVELVPQGVGDPGWQHRHGGVRVGGVSNPGFSAPYLPSFTPDGRKNGVVLREAFHLLAGQGLTSPTLAALMDRVATLGGGS